MTRFHDGELAVQHRAGVSHEAGRLVGMLDRPDLDGGARLFLARLRFAVIAARDAAGTLWASPLVGPAGFLDAHGHTTEVRARPRPGDPLVRLPVGGRVGMVAIDLPARRRVRVNGTIVAATADGFRIDVAEAYGNCPRYLHPHPVEPGPGGPSTDGYDGAALRPEDVSLITTADTFFLGTEHPGRNADASHRGGEPGFVRIEGGTLVWDDRPGNNMFNSLGNLVVDPEAALLFVDFATGAALHLSGSGELEWSGTERRVRFTPQRVVAPATPLAIRVRPLSAG